MRRGRPAWRQAHADVAAFNAASEDVKRGVGIGCMWYGIGNTSMSNPSRMKIGLAADGTLTLFNGALDIGQGSKVMVLRSRASRSSGTAVADAPTCTR